MDTPATPPPNEATITDEINNLRRSVRDVRMLLGAQREVLAKANLGLPPGVMSGLSQMAQTLETMQSRVGGQEREVRQLRALANIGSVVNSSLDLGSVLGEVMDTIIKLTGAERGFLMLRNERGDLDFTIARNLEREDLRESDFEISRTIVERVAELGEPVVTTNAQEDPRFGRQESVVAYNLRSILCVPLRVKGVTTGVIYCDNRIRTGLFNETDRDILAAFSDQAAVAIENARLFESVNRSLHEVTQLKNLMDNVFASIASGVITTDFADRITLINRAATDILGLPLDGVLGRPYTEAFPVADTQFRNMLTEVRTSERRLVGVELTSELPMRGHVDLTFNATPLRDEAQQTQGVAIVMDDITERKRLRNKYELFQRMVPPAVVENLNLDKLQLGGERQDVTCLFADIRGFTRFSENLDPVVLLDVINKYLGAAAEAVMLHEGTLDKFMGDAVMAIWNAPVAQPDHVERAVRAALSMRADILALHEVLPDEFRLMFGVGLNTGEAVVGQVGTTMRLDYTAIGDTVNTAKRIQENAGPGQIVLSDTVYEIVRDMVIVRPMEPMKVKNRVQPVPVYELLDLK